MQKPFQMRKYIFFFFISMLLLVSCIKNYPPFGEDAFIYFLNGDRQHPRCRVLVPPDGRSDAPGFELYSDWYSGIDSVYVLKLCDITTDVHVFYYINQRNFHGPGTYSLDNGLLDSCQVYRGLTHYLNPSGNSFLHVLEWDSTSNRMNALFEARMTSDDGEHIDITHGMFNLKLRYQVF